MSQVVTMSKPVSSSAALPIAHVVLRILIVVNWLGGASILALLLVMPNEQWIMTALLLTFLLARVFAEGTLMRDDLEGTV
jgi:hypothetical protein